MLYLDGKYKKERGQNSKAMKKRVADFMSLSSTKCMTEDMCCMQMVEHDNLSSVAPLLANCCLCTSLNAMTGCLREHICFSTNRVHSSHPFS